MNNVAKGPADISNSVSLFDFLSKYANSSKTNIFRGVASNKFDLVPSIGRKKNVGGFRTLNLNDERAIFNLFKQRSQRFLTRTYDDMNLLAIAQHHGLPTRLLDWTFNPLAALFFAVEHEIPPSVDLESAAQYSLIYVYETNEINFNELENKVFTSIEVENLEFFMPDSSDDRIVNQSGLFTVHPTPWDEPYDHSDIRRISIDLGFRRELRKILNRLGVHRGTLFPDLDGVAKHLNWMKTDDY